MLWIFFKYFWHFFHDKIRWDHQSSPIFYPFYIERCHKVRCWEHPEIFQFDVILEKWSGLLTHSLSFQDSGCSRGRERGLSRWGFINPLHKCTVIIAALLYVLYFGVSPWDFILDKRHFFSLKTKKRLGTSPLPQFYRQGNWSPDREGGMSKFIEQANRRAQTSC